MIRAIVQFNMDPLSTVLSLLKPRSYMSGGLDLGGEWSIQFGQYDGIKCYALEFGECWLAVEGLDPVHLSAGDCCLLPSGRPFRLASDLHLRPVNVLSMLPLPLNGAIVTLQGGGCCMGLGGHFGLSGDAAVLLGELPPIVHFWKESDRAAMRWSMGKMMEELRNPQPGGALVAEQLAYMMLVQALRLHLTEKANHSPGWLSALADPQMNKAMICIHGDPAHRWTLQELAEQVGMSRSGFALRFKEVVGTSAMEYLTRWRMLLAKDKLANSVDSLATIAASVGYDSESAFSVAFKRVTGSSPRQYSRKTKPAFLPACVSPETHELAVM